MRAHWYPLMTRQTNDSLATDLIDLFRKKLISPLIEKSPPSGVVDADYLKLAKEKYYNENHHLFKMDLAWEVVRHHDKWKNHTGTAPKREATSHQPQAQPLERIEKQQ
ncbi:hypothetical protein KEM48_008287 [Puccinia striiformis f. sp. tritici PST-130]|nr:hypothetical protein KEM48_008287 [Puccinia striiformis f. sp. tritici PST-130]